MRRFRNTSLFLAGVVVAVSVTAIPVDAEGVVTDVMRISVTSDGTQASNYSVDPVISADGTTIVYQSPAGNLVPDDGNGTSDIFSFDIATQTTIRASVGVGGTDSDDRSYNGVVSGDGSIVAFESYATNLVSDDTNGSPDVFMYDTGTGVTTLLSRTPAGIPTPVGTSYKPSITQDGSTIVYQSGSSVLVDDDTNGKWDIFSYDVATGTNTKISVGPGGVETDYDSFDAEISADGSVVVFESKATTLVPGDDTNGTYDIFILDLGTDTVTRISDAYDGAESNGRSDSPTVSADGSVIAYQSEASNLVEGDVPGTLDAFVYDVATGVTTLIPVGGAGTINDDWDGIGPAISPDGETVVYHLERQGVAEGGIRDVFSHDLATGISTLVSHGSGGSVANGSSENAVVAPDGSFISFQSEATNIVVPDANDDSNDVLVATFNRPPEAEGFEATVAEDVAVGTTLGTVVTYDVDLDALTYTISSGDPSALFTIGTATGVVTIAQGLDYETANSHTLQVAVSDGHSTANATVLVTVTDADPFDDVTGSVFGADIEWLAESGITKGCGPRLFCPSAHVTRGQMAAFLTRALTLPPTETDYFTDDSGNIFEDSINRLAAADITKGCSDTTFCPNDTVTREQMAAFLTRGLGYTDDGGGNLFDDDDSSMFETHIDKLATAGVTRGCNPPLNSNFCPTNRVTREQMAAFLRRALDT